MALLREMMHSEEVSHITTSAYSMQCSGSRGLVKPWDSRHPQLDVSRSWMI